MSTSRKRDVTMDCVEKLLGFCDVIAVTQRRNMLIAAQMKNKLCFCF